MPLISIVGFAYIGSDKPLISSIADMYIIYSFYKKLNYNIYLGSDIKEIPEGYDMLDMYTSGIVDEGYQTFIKEFTNIRRLITNKDDLELYFKDMEITSDRRLVFYYTGHGVKDNIVLPNNDKYPALELRRNITGAKGLDVIGSQIVIILDCCNAHGMYLPFLYDRGNGSNLMVTNHFVLPQIVLFTSCNEDSKSRANSRYSMFTKELFILLSDRKQTYDFTNIISKLDEVLEDNNCLIRVSTPSIKTAWPWLITNIIDFRISDVFNVVVVKRH